MLSWYYRNMIYFLIFLEVSFVSIFFKIVTQQGDFYNRCSLYLVTNMCLTLLHLQVVNQFRNFIFFRYEALRYRNNVAIQLLEMSSGPLICSRVSNSH